MSDAMKTYTADAELATLIKAAVSTGEPLRVKANGTTFVVHVERETEAATTDIWADYDPEKLRVALRGFAGSWSDLDADELNANLYRAREEGSRPTNQP